MKVISLVLNAALALSFAALPAPAQEKPQQDTPPPQTAKRITRVKQGGNLTAKMLIVKVQPRYPREAREQHIQGTVRLHVIIANDGSIKQIEALDGDPVLTAAATDAVRQWKYRVTYLNGELVEVDTTVDVIFSLRQ
jgi:TonB family protein